MNKIPLIIFLLLISVAAFPQKNWVKTDIEDMLSVKLPTAPTFSRQHETLLYVSESNNCNFIVLLQYNNIPNYSALKKKPVAEQQKFINIYFDLFMNRYIKKVDKLISSQSISIAGYPGKDLAYWVMNDYTGKLEKQFMKAIMMDNVMVSFFCTYFENDLKGQNEKNNFFNSINIKNHL